MEPLSALLIAALSAAAGSAASSLGESIGNDARATIRRKLAGWTRLEERGQRAAAEQAIVLALEMLRAIYRNSPSSERALALLTASTEGCARLRQALFEELLFNAQPNMGRLADLYRRQVAFEASLRREPAPAWGEAETVFRGLVIFTEQAFQQQPALKSPILERDEARAFQHARLTAATSADSATTLPRIEALLSELAQLPHITATITASDGSEISNAPITVVMGDNYAHTIPPVSESDLDRLYKSYRDFVVKSVGTLDFRGIAQVQNIVRLRLEDIYVPLRSSDTAGRTRDVRVSQQEAAEGEQKVIRLSEVETDIAYRLGAVQETNSLHVLVRDRPYLVVLGDPGAGKSTLVKMVMLALAEGRAGQVFGLDDEWLPILFPVAAFAEVRGDPGSRDIAPLEYLRKYHSGRQQPDYTPLFERALLAGRALVLFDGLDEVRDDRLAIVKCLEDFMRAWDAPGNRFLATSRIAGYDDAPLDATLFNRAVVDAMNDDEIRQFSRNWSRAYERAGLPDVDSDDPELMRRASDHQQRLESAVFGDPGVTALARNPLLLTILALINNQGTRLPDRRVDLYRLCVEALAETWNRARSIGGREIDVYLGDEKLDERFVVNVLGPAALWIHEENPGGIVEERDLERKLTDILAETDGLPRGKAARLAANFLQIINRETGLLQERGYRRYGFLHLTFEEYLAARALIEADVVGDSDTEIHRHAADSGWREVLRLALASASQKEAARLLQHLLKAPTDSETRGRPAVLAGLIVLDIGNAVPHRAQVAVTEALLATIADAGVSLATRLETAQVLGRRGDPRLLNVRTGQAEGIEDYSGVESYWCEIESGPFWFGDERVGRPSPGANRGQEESAAVPVFDATRLRQVELRHAFKIGRFPVTNAEFARFLEANGPNGYDVSKPWWTNYGREYFANRSIPIPRYFDNNQFNQPNQPIVGISWYEAAAYCRWLTEMGHVVGWLPPDQIIRLPTSLEWERAARHTDTRPYPWGSGPPTVEHANFKDTQIGAPSPVGCFPRGRAVCGADDLIGNVLEWLATPYEAPEQAIPQEDFTTSQVALLSYTYYRNGLEQLYCGARNWYNPNFSYNFRSFRVVQSVTFIK